MKTIRAAQRMGKKVTAKALKIASKPTGKEPASDILAKILARLEALKTQKNVSWIGTKKILERIIEVAAELKGGAA